MNKRNQLILVIALLVVFLIGAVAVIINLNGSGKDEETEETPRQEQRSVLGANWEPEGEEDIETPPQEPDQVEGEEVEEQPREIRHDYEYYNMDGLYFISDPEQSLLKEKFEEFLSTLDLQDVTIIRMPGKVEQESENIFLFWFKLNDQNLTIIKGLFHFDTDEYEFQIETDEGIIDEFNATELVPADGIDPYAAEAAQEGEENA